jgi:hypothetical protein
MRTGVDAVNDGNLNIDTNSTTIIKPGGCRASTTKKKKQERMAAYPKKE